MPQSRNPWLEIRKGYGNDSVRNGPLSSRILHNDPTGRFAPSLTGGGAPWVCRGWSFLGGGMGTFPKTIVGAHPSRRFGPMKKRIEPQEHSRKEPITGMSRA